MKLREKILCITVSLVFIVIIVVLFMALRENKLDKDEWYEFMITEDENIDFYEHLLRYRYTESVELKLSDIEFMEKYALFLVKEIYGDFRADYSMAIDKGDNVLFHFEEKRKPSPNLIGEGKARSIILEKETGKILAIAKTRA
jgi:hypothetical protein